MTLRALVQAIAQARCGGQRTPVLVVPACLSLKRDFIVALCDELIAAAKTEAMRQERVSANSSCEPTLSLQIDWIRSSNGLWSMLSDPVARKRAGAIASSVSRSCGVPANVQVTTLISRPCGDAQEVVFGLCNDRTPLSPWTSPVYLAVSSSSIH